MNDIKPIETEYNGYLFRSRLEARWAVFFDTAGIAYKYEPEGFDCKDAGWYLPDFYLPDIELWAEIKPNTNISESDKKKMVMFAESLPLERDENGEQLNETETENDFVCICGSPWIEEYVCLRAWNIKTNQNDNKEAWCRCPLCERVDLVTYYGKSVQEFEVGTDNIYCEWCDCKKRNAGENEDAEFYKGNIFPKNGIKMFQYPDIMRAYMAARQKRFGERGIA